MNDDPGSLDRLHDIIEPQVNVWWPLAAGWFWLAGLMLLLLAYLLVRYFVYQQHNRYRHEALAELATCEKLLEQDSKNQTLYKIAELLKRTAITAYPRSEVASLTGQAWYAFLDRTGKCNAFVGENAKVFESAIYEGSVATSSVTDTQVRDLILIAKQWIKTHAVVAESAGRHS